jgi:hypothetical protein
MSYVSFPLVWGFFGSGGGGGGGSVNSVTGLDTDNTDPANPVVRISVDDETITGSGTPADPLVSVQLFPELIYQEEPSLSAYQAPNVFEQEEIVLVDPGDFGFPSNGKYRITVQLAAFFDANSATTGRIICRLKFNGSTTRTWDTSYVNPADTFPFVSINSIPYIVDIVDATTENWSFTIQCDGSDANNSFNSRAKLFVLVEKIANG